MVKDSLLRLKKKMEPTIYFYHYQEGVEHMKKKKKRKSSPDPNTEKETSKENKENLNFACIWRSCFTKLETKRKVTTHEKFKIHPEAMKEVPHRRKLILGSSATSKKIKLCSQNIIFILSLKLFLLF